MPMGMVPMMTSQPMRTSGSPFGLPPRSERDQAERTLPMRFRKNTTTASSVPSCVMAVNVAPGSPPMKSPAMRRCALEEMGRNSVRPWTRPRMIASR